MSLFGGGGGGFANRSQGLNFGGGAPQSFGNTGGFGG